MTNDWVEGISNEQASFETNSSIGNALKCENGIILPHWTPLENVSNGNIAFRGIVVCTI